MEHITQRCVPAASAPITKPAGVPNSVFDAGRQARGRARTPRRPPPDLATLVIDAHVPVPPKRSTAGGHYAQIIQRMQVGESVLLSLTHATSLISAATRLGAKTTRRREGREHMRVWLAKAPVEPPAAVRRRKA